MTTPEARFGFGEAATAEQIAGWDIDVKPDGTGLPPGSGSVQQGEELFARLGATCHGAKGEGTDTAPPLVGGIGSLGTDAPLKTVGSFWPYATTLWDYVNRAMPFDRPGALTPSDVYGTVAYLLQLNGIVAEDQVMDATSLPKVRMPNRNGFALPPEWKHGTPRLQGYP